MQTETLRDLANVLLIIGLILAACGTFGVNYFRSKIEKERTEAASDRDRNSISRVTELQHRVGELVTGKDELLKQNGELSDLVKSLRGQVDVRESTIQQLRDDIAAVQKYSYVATLSFNGMVYVGGDVILPTPISQAVEGTWREVGPARFRPVCEPSALTRCHAAIQRFPEFPFTYYALAYCLEKQGDSSWRAYAEKAAEIFQKTTAISGHQRSHDESLAYLNQLLGRK